MSHKQFSAFVWFSRKKKSPARKSSYCAGCSAGTDSWKDIVRQQWNFNSPSSTDEREDYTANLADATALELTIKPDISGGEAHASLQQLQVAVRTR